MVRMLPQVDWCGSGSEEWEHLGRVCKEVAPQEEGEEDSGLAEEVEKEEVRRTA